MPWVSTLGGSSPCSPRICLSFKEKAMPWRGRVRERGGVREGQREREEGRESESEQHRERESERRGERGRERGRGGVRERVNSTETSCLAIIHLC